MPKMYAFKDGVTINKTTIHRGDIFITKGVFKPIEDIEEDDHLICKENRPVLIISNDNTNKHLVKALPLTSKFGCKNNDSVTQYRLIAIPSFSKNIKEESYIDVSQIFTINVSQLQTKIASVSQNIVDTAATLVMTHLLNNNSVATMIDVWNDIYPNSIPGNNEDSYSDGFKYMEILRNPFDDIYSPVEKVDIDQLDYVAEPSIDLYPATIDKAYSYYKEWRNIGTAAFRYKYHLSKQEYNVLRNNSVHKMIRYVKGFKKYDWQG